MPSLGAWSGGATKVQSFGAVALVSAVALYLRLRRLRTREAAGKANCHAAPNSVDLTSPAEDSSTAATTECPEEVDFEARVRREQQLILEAAATVQMVIRTGAFWCLPHPHAAKKQLCTIADKLEEVADCTSPHNIFWRYGREQPMADLLELPLLRLAASCSVIVPVSLGYVKEPGELAVARFLVSGTDANKSRYREFSSGILDAVQRDRLLFRLEWLFQSVWDLPLTWGDEADNLPLGGSVNPHNASAFGVSIHVTTGLSS